MAGKVLCEIRPDSLDQVEVGTLDQQSARSDAAQQGRVPLPDHRRACLVVERVARSQPHLARQRSGLRFDWCLSGRRADEQHASLSRRPIPSRSADKGCRLCGRACRSSGRPPHQRATAVGVRRFAELSRIRAGNPNRWCCPPAVRNVRTWCPSWTCPSEPQATIDDLPIIPRHAAGKIPDEVSTRTLS